MDTVKWSADTCPKISFNMNFNHVDRDVFSCFLLHDVTYWGDPVPDYILQ